MMQRRMFLTWTVWALLTASAAEEAPYGDPKRFESAVCAFEAHEAKAPPPKGAIVCAGSSSIRGWHKTIAEDLAPLEVVPRGFGGSNMNDLLHYLDRLVIPHAPKGVVIYEGDNDVAQGVPPAVIRDAFVAVAKNLRNALPDVRIYFLSIKPSVARWSLWPQMQEANALIEAVCDTDDALVYVDVSTPMLDEDSQVRPELFLADNLHMNREGYRIWRDVLKPILLRDFGAKP